MMNKAKSSSLTVAKYFLIVPLFFILMAANSIYAAQNEDNTVTIQSAGENSHVLAQPAMGQGDLNTVLSGAPDETNGNEIISVRDDQPQYPGGEQALMRYMADNIRYPVIAQENGIQGRVVCTFAITKDGSIDNVGVLHGVDPSLDAEAMRIIKMMPKWEPATKQGKTVDTHAMISVVFRLQGDGPDDLLTKEEREALFEKNKPSRAEIKDGTLLIDEVVVVGYGAKKSTVQQILDRDKENSADGDEVFVVVEVQPQFPGGIDALNKFIKENLRYPEEAREQAIQGRVICAFIVAKDGSLEDVEVVRSLATSLDAEALRVIKSMPAWKPGTQRGNTVRVRYVLPVTFGFEDKNDTGKVS